ncbi:glycosyl hydrolase [Thermopirellula anaerolimosa]
MKWYGVVFAALLFFGWGNSALSAAPDDLLRGFAEIPDDARPWVYWFWLDGNISREGITADLEAMKRAGIGGVLIMEVDQGAPAGPVRFASPAWREMFAFMLAEAHRLGLKVNMNNDGGWTGSGGPWIQPEQAMHRLVWSEMTVEGPNADPIVLPRPPVVENYYRDVAVLAFPRPAEPARIPGIAGKSLAQPLNAAPVLPAVVEEPPADRVIPLDAVLDLTDKMDAEGRLAWDVPEGRWTVLRFGHTPTGARNHPSPAEGRGLECDKLSADGADAMFAGLMGKLIADSPDLVGEEQTLVSTHIDSWEVGSQNWTARMPVEFRTRRGYDIRPYLPVIAGYVVGGRETSERFLWDFRQTIGDLVLDRYAGRFRELARQHGMRLTIEAYTTCPVDELAYAGRADEPMGEFWSWSKYGAAFSCTEMASAAHVYGKKIVGAEAFTATDAERWLGHPGNIKDLGDWAFCEGINRFVFHRYALQPWTNPDRPPGMSMGPWGLHYERTQTWWDYARPWHDYLARCQYLLQKGLFVADLCFLTPEGTPQTLGGQSAISQFGRPRERGGFNYDFCPPEVVLTRMSVKDGRLVLPDGMSYSMLVLPRIQRMTPPLAEKIAELVQEGATVIGGPPVKAPGLTDFPVADRNLRAIVERVWGTMQSPAEPVLRRYGKGRILFGGPFSPIFQIEERPGLEKARWIWTDEGNPVAAVPIGHRYFRRVFQLPPDAKIASAWLVMTADNEFECMVNGRRVGHGDDFHRPYRMNVTGLLKPGANLIAVDAFNAADSPNPAGLIAALHLQFADGRSELIVSDSDWRWMESPVSGWDVDPTASGDWKTVREAGPLGIPPWGDVSDQGGDPNMIADIDAVENAAEQLGLMPDFHYESAAGDQPLRYIHRRIDSTDVYFVANKTDRPVEAACRFRVTGKRPQFRRPETGEILPAPAWREHEGCTELPLRLDAFESVFVVFVADEAPGEHIVGISRDGQEILWPGNRRGSLVIRKALYGVLDDPSRTRDVTAKVQRLVDDGKLRFPVADLARDDDPAYLVVKRLVVEYEVDGHPGRLEAFDPQVATFPRAAVEEPALELRASSPDRRECVVWRPGRYTVKTSEGREIAIEIPQLPASPAPSGTWEVEFEPAWGGPGKLTIESLLSWHEFPEPGVQHYSGRAVYRTTLHVDPASDSTRDEVLLDLGRVEVAAEVKINGKSAGIVWRPPYRLAVGRLLKPGDNTLEIAVVNLWINRQIGDELLPEDSDRNPSGTLKSWPDWLAKGLPSPTGRRTFTSWRLWKKGDPLQPSGLLGPVTIRRGIVVDLSSDEATTPTK